MFSRGMMSSGSDFEEFLLQRVGMSLLIILLVSYKFLSVSYYSARIFNGGVPEHDVSDIPTILWQFVHDPLDPNAAFEPVNEGTALPGPIPFWLTFFVTLAAHLIVGLAIFYALRRHREQGGGDNSLWADDNEAADLMHPTNIEPSEHELLVVGQRGRKPKYVAVNRVESLLALGPSYAGKTGAIAIPSLLEWDGPALVVSTKVRTIEDTIEWRGSLGRTRVFDPASTTRFGASGWSMLSYCGHWEGAIHMAQHLTAGVYGSASGSPGASSPAERVDQGSPLWGGAMAMTLAPFLYAGAADGRSVMEVAEWLEREDYQHVLRILGGVDDIAAHTLETAFFREDPDRSTYLHHMYQLLSIYGDPVVASSSTKDEIQPRELLNGRGNTYYLTAPEHDRTRFQPLFASIVRQVLAAVNTKIAQSSQGLDPPLLVLVDGAIGSASLQLMAQMSLTGRDRGVEVLTIFNERDWEQASQNGVADTLVKAHRSMLLLRGADIGDSNTVTAASWEQVAYDVRADEGALFYEDRRPIRVDLRYWWEEDDLRTKVEDPTAALPANLRPSIDNPAPVESVPEYNLVDQASMWRTRNQSVRGQDMGPEETVGTGRTLGRRMNVFQNED